MNVGTGAPRRRLTLLIAVCGLGLALLAPIGPVAASAPARDVTLGWTVLDLAGDDPILGISCPTSSFCAATDTDGDIVTTTNPGGGAAPG